MKCLRSIARITIAAGGIAPLLLTTGSVSRAAPAETEAREDRASGSELLERLRSTKRLESEEAFQQLRKQRSEMIRQLCRIAKPKGGAQTPAHVRRRAILLLAEFGPRQTIPFLVENIDHFVPPLFASGESIFLTEYPCALALVEIGQSSVAGIVTHLQAGRYRQTSDKAIELYARTVLAVYIGDRAGHKEAVAVVRRARDRAPHKEGLDRLLRKLEELTKDFD